MSAVVSKGTRIFKPISIQGALHDEIAHWLFLERGDNPLNWHRDRHLQVTIATDVSQIGRGGSISTPVKQETPD